MNVSRPPLRMIALSVALAALGVIAVQMLSGEAQPVERASASATHGASQVVPDSKVRRAGRMTYVKTKFAISPVTGGRGDAFCPRGSQLTGAFGSGFVSDVNRSTTLAATLVREDGQDRGRVADNGVRAIVTNPTSIAGQGTVEAICERAKKKRRR